MESERECPAPGLIQVPVQTWVSWCQDMRKCLVNIEQSIPTDKIGEARTQELEERWAKANPTMPSRGAALRQQLYRMRKEKEQSSSQEEPQDQETPRGGK